MNWLNVKVIEGGKPPERKSAGAAGLDCYARGHTRAMPYSTTKVPLGFAAEIPEGHVGMLVLRSGVASGGLVAAPGGVGIIDSDFRGEISAVISTRDEAYNIPNGERIAQLVVVPVPYLVVREVASLSPTERGEGGFGSTGVR